MVKVRRLVESLGEACEGWANRELNMQEPSSQVEQKLEQIIVQNSNSLMSNKRLEEKLDQLISLTETQLIHVKGASEQETRSGLPKSVLPKSAFLPLLFTGLSLVALFLAAFTAFMPYGDAVRSAMQASQRLNEGTLYAVLGIACLLLARLKYPLIVNTR